VKKKGAMCGKFEKKISKIDLRQTQVVKLKKWRGLEKKIAGKVHKDRKEYFVQVDLRLPQARKLKLDRCMNICPV